MTARRSITLAKHKGCSGYLDTKHHTHYTTHPSGRICVVTAFNRSKNNGRHPSGYETQYRANSGFSQKAAKRDAGSVCESLSHEIFPRSGRIRDWDCAKREADEKPLPALGSQNPRQDCNRKRNKQQAYDPRGHKKPAEALVRHAVCYSTSHNSEILTGSLS